VHWSFLNENPDESLKTFTSSVGSALHKMAEEARAEQQQQSAAASDECKLLTCEAFIFRINFFS